MANDTEAIIEGIIGRIGEREAIGPPPAEKPKRLTPSKWILQRLRDTKGAAKPDLLAATAFFHSNVEAGRSRFAEMLKGVYCEDDLTRFGDHLILLKEIEQLLCELRARRGQ